MFTMLMIMLCLTIANSQLSREKANSPSESNSTTFETASSGGNTTVDGFLNITDGRHSCA